MSELVKIPAASAEYMARFDRPCIALIGIDRGRAFEAVVAALLPFQLRLANTQFVDSGTPADYKVILKLPDRGITFQFGAEEYRFSKDGSSWGTVEEDMRVMLAAKSALMEIAEKPALANTTSSVGHIPKVESCAVTLAMHLQLLNKPREEVLEAFIPAPFRDFVKMHPTQRLGNHLVFADGDVLMDYSLAYANAIFLRMNFQFAGHPPLEEVLTKVRSDEETMFGILGIEEEKP